MRALVVSTAHPLDAAVYDSCIRRLLDDGWDVVYAAPFAEHAVRPPAGLTGLDLPAAGKDRQTPPEADSVLRFRGPEADLVVVASDELAAIARRWHLTPIQVVPAAAPPSNDERGLRRPADGPAGSWSTPSATGSAGAGPDRSAIPPQSRRTRIAARLDSDVAER